MKMSLWADISRARAAFGSRGSILPMDEFGFFNNRAFGQRLRATITEYDQPSPFWLRATGYGATSETRKIVNRNRRP